MNKTFVLFCDDWILRMFSKDKESFQSKNCCQIEEKWWIEMTPIDHLDNKKIIEKNKNENE